MQCCWDERLVPVYVLEFFKKLSLPVQLFGQELCKLSSRSDSGAGKAACKLKKEMEIMITPVEILIQILYTEVLRKRENASRLIPAKLIWAFLQRTYVIDQQEAAAECMQIVLLLFEVIGEGVTYI
eukprot:1159553-Pelagomonas_calceolata.AAC.4